MLINWTIGALHLLALAIGFAAIWTRARTLGTPLDERGLKRLFAADSVWGLAALLWIVTGAARAFGGLEKGTSYYLASDAFWLKMILLAVILLLEIWPMAAFVKWRIRHRKQLDIDTARAGTFSRISYLQAALVVAMVFAASAMARGLGF